MRDFEGSNVDERAEKFYSRVYTGKYELCFNTSHEDLRPTSTYSIGSRDRCVYCHDTAKPIQAGLRGFKEEFRHYKVTGYTCICKGAMDEYDLHDTLNKIREEMEEKMEAAVEAAALIIDRDEIMNKLMSTLNKQHQDGRLSLRDIQEPKIQDLRPGRSDY